MFLPLCPLSGCGSGSRSVFVSISCRRNCLWWWLFMIYEHSTMSLGVILVLQSLCILRGSTICSSMSKIEKQIRGTGWPCSLHERLKFGSNLEFMPRLFPLPAMEVIFIFNVREIIFVLVRLQWYTSLTAFKQKSSFFTLVTLVMGCLDFPSHLLTVTQVERETTILKGVINWSQGIFHK